MGKDYGVNTGNFHNFKILECKSAINILKNIAGTI